MYRADLISAIPKRLLSLCHGMNIALNQEYRYFILDTALVEQGPYGKETLKNRELYRSDYLLYIILCLENV